MSEYADYLPITRTIRYRTDDPVQNLRIKVVMKCLEGEDTESRWITKERIFSWQEKVFGPTEFVKYKALAADNEGKGARRKKGLTPLEERYTSQIEHAAVGEDIFSYTDADSFEDIDESIKPLTTSPFEKPTPLTERLMAVHERRGRHSELSDPFKIMYLVAEVKGRIDVTARSESGPTYIKQDKVLCAIKAHSDGTIDMTPGFSPKPNIKVDVMKSNTYKLASALGTPYRIETESGCVYEYWLMNDTEPKEASEVAALNLRQLRFQQDLFGKSQELRRNFVGDEFEAFSDSPDLDSCKVMLNMEIVSATDFEMDHLYVQYLLDIPEGWATGDAPQLWAHSQVSRVRHIKDETGATTTRAVAHFALPIELSLWKARVDPGDKGMRPQDGRPPKGTKREPCMLIQVNSYDMWDRQRILGYGHLQLPCSPGTTEHTIRTWRPALTQIGKLRSFFIGGTPELRDLTFAGVPTTMQQSTLSRYGFSSESAGSVRVRCHCMVQGPKSIQVDHTKAREMLKPGGHAVADSSKPGRSREAALIRARTSSTAKQVK